MPPLTYRTVDGLTVRLTYERWVEHISPRHPEVTLEDVENALTQTTRICAHKEHPNRRVYEGQPRAHELYARYNWIPTVAVQLDSKETGWVITAYRAPRRYQGAQLWPPT
jgi:hypothetical protein